MLLPDRDFTPTIRGRGATAAATPASKAVPMPQHARPEILHHALVAVTEKVPTCHRCSWAWRPGGFAIKWPSAACEDPAHRGLLDGAAGPLAPLSRAS